MSCKLIAEIGWNHMGDMVLAETMIAEAALAGANFVKFQSWNEKKLKPGPWDLDGRRAIYKQAQLSPQSHQQLKAICDKYQVEFLTSCFCVDDLQMIRDLTNTVKIASTECNNIPLVERAIDMFDTVLISTGAMTVNDYRPWAESDKVWLLHCVSAYPCKHENVNLSKLEFISTLTPRFGYSGHAEGVWDAIAAISLGARIIEKHFTTNHELPGRDNKFAILPTELKQIHMYIESFNSMKINHGNDYQIIETDARNIYAGRWSS
jgi:sialic acid synthase SpsE